MNKSVLVIAGLIALSGCTSTSLIRGGSGDGKTATGSRADIIRSMNGGLVGGSVGAALSSAEKTKALEAEYRALEYMPSGQKVSWTGDGSGRGGEVVAAQPYRVGSQDCRQYTHKVTADGRSSEARGTACRNSDGSWTPLT